MIGHEIVRTTDKERGIDAPVPPTICSGQPARDMRRIASFFCLVRGVTGVSWNVLLLLCGDQCSRYRINEETKSVLVVVVTTVLTVTVVNVVNAQLFMRALPML